MAREAAMAAAPTPANMHARITVREAIVALTEGK